MSQDRVVHSGYRRRQRQEWVDVFVQESLRDELRCMASRYTKLRAAVQNWATSRGLENEGKYLHALLREVGRWPENNAQDTFRGKPWEDLDTRTEVERQMDGLRFVGAHRRQR